MIYILNANSTITPNLLKETTFSLFYHTKICNKLLKIAFQIKFDVLVELAVGTPLLSGII
jgi:hypothetical protein